jgi:hexosaminidase
MRWKGSGRAAVQIAALLWLAASPAPARDDVIPQPLEVRLQAGAFSVNATTVIRVPSGDSDAARAAHYLVELWTRTNGFALPVVVANGAGAAGASTIAFRRESGFGPEGYGIAVAPKLITVSGSTAAGLFYGAVTLWQLLPAEGHTGTIRAQIIRDAPRYVWRGLMLDSARHFQSVAFIRSTIDWMAWHKLNVLHWHLTDDQGWRLEIRRYPRLTSIGAWRVEPDGTRYGGFYTQAEVRDIVRYAASRHVQIVPEIDMPGHATAAIAAYPFLGAAPSAAQVVSASWGVHSHLFNVEPRTFRFLENVLDEVVRLFPSAYVHIGGDEVVTSEWDASPQVRATARKLGMSDDHTLQAYFTDAIGSYLAAHGRRIIGWDEILHPGLEKSAVVMSWHGVSGAHGAAATGHDAILSPWPTLYFDNRQSTLPTEPTGRLKVVSLEDVYDFDPDDATLSQTEQAHVLGVQANLWTEHMRSEDGVVWMALPRAAALAEVAWSSAKSRNFADFLERLVPMFARYQAFGLDYSDSVFRPAAEIERGAAGFTVTLSTQSQRAGVGEIRYTLDGREPSMQSSLYESPVGLADGTEMRAATFVDSTRASRSWVKVLDAASARRRDSHDMTPCSEAIGLLLQPGARAAGSAAEPPIAVDIMNPCWIDHGVDLSAGPRVVAAVAALPFNYQVGADAAKIRLGARTPEGELEIHVDGCDTPVVADLPLASASRTLVTVLPPQRLPRVAGRHDLCLRFARPRLDPLWALDWVEIGE